MSERLLSRRLETLWQGADPTSAEPSARADHRIFTSVLFHLYSAPLGYPCPLLYLRFVCMYCTVGVTYHFFV